MGKVQHVTADMRKSMEMVNKHESIILEMLKARKIICVEGDDNEVLRMLDLTCGIDYYHDYENGLVRGIGSRWQTVRNGARPFNTFTIRKSRESGASTEYEKRKLAIERGGEYPYLTIHGYVNDYGELLSIGIAKTKDIIECIGDGHYTVQHTGYSQIGQASFYVVKWDEMHDLGYLVLTREFT